MQKETSFCKWVLIVNVNERFNTAFDNIDDNKSARCNWMFVLTELVTSGTQCTSRDWNEGSFALGDNDYIYFVVMNGCSTQSWRQKMGCMIAMVTTKNDLRMKK